MPNIFDYNPANITPYPYWRWNKVLPAVYDDSLSQYEIMSKLLYTVNEIITATNDTGTQVEQLTQLVQQLIDGQFPEGIVQYVEDIAQATVDDDIDAINDTIQHMRDELDYDIDTIAALIPSSAFNSTNTVKKYVDDSITTVNTTIATLEKAKTELVVLGDSLSTCSYNSDTQQVVSSGAELWTKVAESTGLNVHNYAVGGAGFYYTGFSNKTIQSQLADAIADTTYDADRVKCVIAFAGTNDYLNITTSNMQTAISNLCNAYQGSRFANAHVPFYIVFDQGGHGWNCSFFHAVGLRTGHMLSAKYVSILNGSSILKAFPTSYPYIGSDGVHPSNYGYNALAQSFTRLIEGTGFLLDRGYAVNAYSPAPDGITASANAYVENGELICRGSINFAANKKQTDATNIPILRFPHMWGSLNTDNVYKIWTKSYASAIYEQRAKNANLSYSLTFTQDGYDAILNVLTMGIATTAPVAAINTSFTLRTEI